MRPLRLVIVSNLRPASQIPGPSPIRSKTFPPPSWPRAHLSITTQSPPVTVGQFVQTYFGYKPSMKGWLLLILASFSACFFAASTAALRVVKWQTR